MRRRAVVRVPCRLLEEVGCEGNRSLQRGGIPHGYDRMREYPKTKSANQISCFQNPKDISVK